MGKHPRHLSAILCVLLLNLQVFAAQAMGCMHQGEEPAVAGCPHMLETHAAATSTPTPAVESGADALEPCQKCSLDAVAAGWNLHSASTPALTTAASPIPRTLLSPSLPRHAADALLRPPRRLPC
jgi:hypothetical protein